MSFEEMEVKRQQMTQGFRDLADQMTRCVALIEDYTRLVPSTLTTKTALAHLDDAGGLGAFAGADGLPGTGKKVRAKREKKIRDPNAPKRPPSAYILFQNEIREQVRSANPGLAYKDVLSVIAQQWKELPETSKKVYEKAYSDANLAWRTMEEQYNSGAAPAAAAVTAGVSDESSEEVSDDSDDDDDEPPVLQTPTPVTLASIAPQSSVKKEKKRKNKEDEANVSALLESADKKQKKKKNKE